MTVDDDPYYSFVLLINSVTTFVAFIWHIMAQGALRRRYNLLRTEKAYEKQIEKEGIAEEFRSGDCDFGMIEGDDGLCYNP